MTFPSERPILERERKSGSYRLSAYFMSKTIAETPLRWIYPTIFLTVAYWMGSIGAPDVRADIATFAGLLCISLLSVTAAEALGCTLGCAFADTRKALAATTVTVILLMLMGGLFIPLSQIPVWMQWIKFISIWSYANNASLALIFRVPTPCGGAEATTNTNIGVCIADPTATADKADVLRSLGLSDGLEMSLAFNWSMIIVWGLVVRYLAYLALRYAKPKDNLQRH